MKKEKTKTSPFLQVYEIVAQIPKGKVMTYGQISRMLQGQLSAVAVGWAMNQAPQGLPCHRVVRSDGKLCREEIFGGIGVQQALLESEGIEFLQAGLIDMKKFEI